MIFFNLLYVQSFSFVYGFSENINIRFDKFHGSECTQNVVFSFNFISKFRPHLNLLNNATIENSGSCRNTFSSSSDLSIPLEIWETTFNDSFEH